MSNRNPALVVIKNEDEIAQAAEEGDTFIDKRVYVPGVTLESLCPKCGTTAEIDLACEYVTQYPVSGRAYEVTFECENELCLTEWVAGKMKYVLTVEWVE